MAARCRRRHGEGIGPIEQQQPPHATSALSTAAASAVSDAGAAPTARADRFGRARASMRAFRGAQRYSQFVRAMKVMLPIAAFAIVGVVVSYALLYDTDDELTVTFAASPTLKDDRRMMNPTFSARTQDGGLFEVTAETAERSIDNPSRVLLGALKADLTALDGGKVALTADTGILNLDEQQVVLDGSISVFSDEGYEFHTERVVVDLEQQSIQGDAPVEGTGPMGAVAAERFWVGEGGTRVRFEGGVRMSVDPAPLTGQDPAAREPASGLGERKG